MHNVKALLIERERAKYAEGDTEQATFLAGVLEDILELEDCINELEEKAESVSTGYFEDLI